MAPKFIIDINLPETSAEDQMAACQKFLEERLEDFSATSLTIEPVEGDDNIGVDTRKEEKPEAVVEEKKPVPNPALAKKSLSELHVLVLRTKEGIEGIATLKNLPIVFSDRAKFDVAKKAFRSQLMADPAPAGMKFFHKVYIAAREIGEVK